MAFEPDLRNINVQIGNYSLILTDGGRTTIEVNSASPCNVTIPANASIPFPIGTEIQVRQMGTGAVTIVGSSGVTIESPNSLSTTAQYSTLTLFKRNTDDWIIVEFGPLGTSGSSNNVTGPFTATGTVTGSALSTTGSVTAGAISASGNATVGGTLAVTGQSTFSNQINGTTVSTSGDITAGGSFNTTNAVTAGTLHSTGNTTVGGNLSVTGAFSPSSISTTGNATVGGTLGVTGQTTLGVVTLGNTTINGTFSLSGAFTPASVSTAGGVTAGGHVVSAPSGTTASSIYGSIGTTGFVDQMQGVALMPSSVTNATGQYTGIAGYVRNQAAQDPNAGQPNGVAVFGAATGEVDSSATWGINTISQDSATRAAGTGTGRHLLNEFDFNVMSPDTVISGLNLTGSSLAQPKSATGIGVLPLGSGIRWNQALWSTDGAATYTTVSGLLSSNLTTNGVSQSHLFMYGDNTGTRQYTKLYVEGNPGGPGCIVVLDGGGQPVGLQLNGFMQVGGAGQYFSGTQLVVGPRVSGWGTYNGGTPGYLNSATATASQCALAINALINALMNQHGLLGP